MVRTFTEPTLDDLLADPLVQMVMRSDGISRGFVRELMDSARQALSSGSLKPVHLGIRPAV
ncbi:MAG: hypothetical protein QM647_13460 [Asticcacaulis sp.]|uniref:hypothetical protein n=1 Tax=Asticcacaulis sp. TaxID=1872648 RepID=UPI0039E4B860